MAQEIVENEVYDYVGTFECKTSRELKLRKGNIDVKFTRVGFLAARNAILHIYDNLDSKSQERMLEIMKTTKTMV